MEENVTYEELAQAYRQALIGPMQEAPTPNSLEETDEVSLATRLHDEAKRLARDEAQGSWAMAEALANLKYDGTWRHLGEYESWAELVNDLGSSAATVNRALRNYKFYVQTIGMSIRDHRLTGADYSKLALGTMKKFSPWVINNIIENEEKRKPYLEAAEELYEQAREIGGSEGHELREQANGLIAQMQVECQDFIDMCQPGFMMNRAEVRKWLESEMGIEPDEDGAAFKRAFESLHKAKKHVAELSDDDYLAFVEEIRQDDEVMEFLTKMMGE